MGARDGPYVDATGLACVSSHVIRSRPGQEAYEGKNGVVDETLAIHL